MLVFETSKFRLMFTILFMAWQYMSVQCQWYGNVIFCCQICVCALTYCSSLLPILIYIMIKRHVSCIAIMSLPSSRGVLVFSSCLSVTKVYIAVHNFSYILNRNSSKLCMLAYYLMKIHNLLQNYDQTVCKGVIALFDFKYFIKMFVCATSTF
jgi:hypothetical protein